LSCFWFSKNDGLLLQDSMSMMVALLRWWWWCYFSVCMFISVNRLHFLCWQNEVIYIYIYIYENALYCFEDITNRKFWEYMSYDVLIRNEAMITILFISYANYGAEYYYFILKFYLCAYYYHLIREWRQKRRYNSLGYRLSQE